VIKVDSPLYQFWKIFVVFIYIISSYIYAYIAAFGKDKQIEYIVLFFEIIFAMDIIVQFLLEFKPEDQYNKVRDITEIAKRYIKSRFLVDAIAMIPFH